MQIGWVLCRPVHAAALLAAAALAAGCQFSRPTDVPDIDAAPDAPGPPTFAVGGTVSGMWTGASVQLVLEALPDPPVAVTVSANGEFSFPGGLVDGRSFTVAVSSGGQPSMHTCGVANAAGSIAGAAVTDVAVTCAFDGVFSITWSAPIAAFAFSVGQTEYNGEAAYTVDGSDVTLDAPAGYTWSVDGGAVTGIRATHLAFDQELERVTIEVHVAGMSHAYTYSLDRTSLVVSDAAYLKASNTDPGDQFGSTIAADGAFVAVGAPFEDSAAIGVGGNAGDNGSADSGAVYVYRRQGLMWMLDGYLKGSTNSSGDHFGTAVALQGSLLVVGAPDDGASDIGAVYVFSRGTSGWSLLQRLPAATINPGQRLGASVAIGSLFVAAGAPGVGAGSAAVFRANPGRTAWTYDRSLSGPAPTSGDACGTSVGLAPGTGGDETLLLGCPLDDGATDTATDAGAVHVYRFDGTNWPHQATLRAANADPGDHFGNAVAIDRDRGLIGADRERGSENMPASNASPNAGAAYVFERSGTTWTQAAYLKLAGSAPLVRFGYSVALRRDLALVGAPAIGELPGGAVRLFRLVGGIWQPADGLMSPVLDEQDTFGASVALSGEGVLIAAPLEDGAGTTTTGSPADNGAAAAGAVYAFY